MVCEQYTRYCGNLVMNDDTPSILKDYLAYCMRRSGYDTWAPDFPKPTPTNYMKRLRILGDQYEEAFFRVFDDMINNFELYTPQARDNFSGVVSVVFDNGNGIAWGRILGVIVFSSKLCIKAMRDNRPDVVENIYTWLSELFATEQLSNWMAEHDGWVCTF